MLKHLILAVSVSLLAVACGGGTPEAKTGDDAAKPAEGAPADAKPADGAAPADAKPADGAAPADARPADAPK